MVCGAEEVESYHGDYDQLQICVNREVDAPLPEGDAGWGYLLAILLFT